MMRCVVTIEINLTVCGKSCNAPTTNKASAPTEVPSGAPASEESG